MNDVEGAMEMGSAGNGAILGWLTRTYAVQQDWHAKARAIYFETNGDSELARHRVATLMRNHFLESRLNAEVVERLTGLGTVDEKVIPPKVTASNASYFDWLRVADYLLLPSTSTDDIDVENQRRESQFQQLLGSCTLRMQVNAARQVIRRDSSIPEADVLAEIQRQFANASLANVKEAKRMEAAREPLLIPIMPGRVNDLPRYKSLS